MKVQQVSCFVCLFVCLFVYYCSVVTCLINIVVYVMCLLIFFVDILFIDVLVARWCVCKVCSVVDSFGQIFFSLSKSLVWLDSLLACLFAYLNL